MFANDLNLLITSPIDPKLNSTIKFLKDKGVRLSEKFVQLSSYYKRETYGFYHCVERPYLG